MERAGRMGGVVAKPLYLCIHIAEFPAQARLRVHPEKARSPVAILEGDPPFEAVCSANHRARVLGVSYGLTRGELNSYPAVLAVRRCAAEESAARAALLHMAAAFTPRTQIYSTPCTGSPSLVVVMDICGTGRIFGNAQKLAERVQRAVCSLRLKPRLAVSNNFHTAVCASAFAEKHPHIIEGGTERAVLSRLPLDALGLTADERTTFALWGLRSVGELAELPETELAIRLGAGGRRLHKLARGEHDQFMVPEEPALSLEEQVQFDDPVDNLDSLLFVLGPMLEQLILRAQAHALAIRSVQLRFSLEGMADYTHKLQPALACEQKEVLLKLLHLALQANPPGAGVLKMHLHAEPGRRSRVQTGLFSPPTPEPTRLDLLLARLEVLVGKEFVGKACLLDTHRPDAFRMEPFTVPQAGEAKPRRATLAVRRLRPPVVLHVQLNHAEPCSFFYEKRSYTVTQIFGPWRSSGDWWSEQIWSCEEWDVCAASPQSTPIRAVLTHDLLRKTWHLDALYD